MPEIKNIKQLLDAPKDAAQQFIVDILKSDPSYNEQTGPYELVAEGSLIALRTFIRFDIENPLISKYEEKVFFEADQDMIKRDGQFVASIKYASHFITQYTNKEQTERSFDSSKNKHFGLLLDCILYPEHRLTRAGHKNKVYYAKNYIFKEKEQTFVSVFEIEIDKDGHIRYVTIMPDKTTSWIENKKGKKEYFDSPSPFLNSLVRNPFDAQASTISPSAIERANTEESDTNIDKNNNNPNKLLLGGKITSKTTYMTKIDELKSEIKEYELILHEKGVPADEKEAAMDEIKSLKKEIIALEAKEAAIKDMQEQKKKKIRRQVGGKKIRVIRKKANQVRSPRSEVLGQKKNQESGAKNQDRKKKKANMMAIPKGIKKFNSGRTALSIERDKQRKAMYPGKRTSADGNTYYENRANRADQNKATRLAGGGSVKDIAFRSSNLYLTGKGMDANGNFVVKLTFPNQTGFSIQTNGTLPETNRILQRINKLSELTPEQLLEIEKEVNAYVKEYGSSKQKGLLKLYSKAEKGGSLYNKGGITKDEYKKLEREYDLLGAHLEDAIEEKDEKKTKELKSRMDAIESKLHKHERDYSEGGSYKKGGHIGFDALSKKIEKSYEKKGYSKAEAQHIGDATAAKIAQSKNKGGALYEKGGKIKLISARAKEIWKGSGKEKWTEAIKRASVELKAEGKI